MLKSIRSQIQFNENVFMLDIIRDQIESLNDLVEDKEALDQEEIEDLMEEAEKVLEVITDYIAAVVELGDRIDYLEKAPGLESLPGFYEDLKAKDQEVEFMYYQLIDLEDEVKDIIRSLSEE